MIVEKVNNIKAFTLAEVLITLTIVGVVVALTIPTLVSKIQDKVLISQFKETYSLLNQALSLTNYERGVPYKCYTTSESVSYAYNECNEFYANFFKNLKAQKTETVTKHPYKTKEEVLQEGGGITNNSCSFMLMEASEVYHLNNGSKFYINQATNPNYQSQMKTYFILDINGDKSPNKWGYDVFYLTPTKRTSGSFRIDEAICTIWEKDGKRAFNIINNTDEVSDKWFFN